MSAPDARWQNQSGYRSGVCANHWSEYRSEYLVTPAGRGAGTAALPVERKARRDGKDSHGYQYHHSRRLWVR